MTTTPSADACPNWLLHSEGIPTLFNEIEYLIERDGMISGTVDFSIRDEEAVCGDTCVRRCWYCMREA